MTREESIKIANQVYNFLKQSLYPWNTEALNKIRHAVLNVCEKFPLITDPASTCPRPGPGECQSPCELHPEPGRFRDIQCPIAGASSTDMEHVRHLTILNRIEATENRIATLEKQVAEWADYGADVDVELAAIGARLEQNYTDIMLLQEAVPSAKRADSHIDPNVPDADLAIPIEAALDLNAKRDAVIEAAKGWVDYADDGGWVGNSCTDKLCQVVRALRDAEAAK